MRLPILYPLFFLIIFLALFSPSFSYPEYLKRLPNGAQLPLVAIGHLDVDGGGQLNQFGKDFVQNGTRPPHPFHIPTIPSQPPV